MTNSKHKVQRWTQHSWRQKQTPSTMNLLHQSCTFRSWIKMMPKDFHEAVAFAKQVAPLELQWVGLGCSDVFCLSSFFNPGSTDSVENIWTWVVNKDFMRIWSVRICSTHLKYARRQIVARLQPPSCSFSMFIHPRAWQTKLNSLFSQRTPNHRATSNNPTNDSLLTGQCTAP